MTHTESDDVLHLLEQHPQGTLLEDVPAEQYPKMEAENLGHLYARWRRGFLRNVFPPGLGEWAVGILGYALVIGGLPGLLFSSWRVALILGGGVLGAAGIMMLVLSGILAREHVRATRYWKHLTRQAAPLVALLERWRQAQSPEEREHAAERYALERAVLTRETRAREY